MGAGGLPGPGSFQNALGAREEFSRVAADGVASSVRDVNRYTAVVSDSPRRRSVGHASRSQLALSRRGSGDIRSVTPATTRACPVGGPGDTRRLGELKFRLHPPDAQARPAGLVAEKRIQRTRQQTRPMGLVSPLGCDPIHPQRRTSAASAVERRRIPLGVIATRGVPNPSFSLVFSRGLTRSHRALGRPCVGPSPSGGPIGWSYRIGCFARAGRPEFPCPCNFGA